MPKKMRIKACEDLTPVGLARRRKAWGKLTSRQQAERWAEALEHGPFAQIERVLYDYDGGRCVLGVLSEVSGSARSTFFRGESESDPNLFYPHVPTILGKNRDTFVTLNDRGQSFGQLAQYIRGLLDDAEEAACPRK